MSSIDSIRFTTKRGKKSAMGTSDIEIGSLKYGVLLAYPNGTNH